MRIKHDRNLPPHPNTPLKRNTDTPSWGDKWYGNDRKSLFQKFWINFFVLGPFIFMFSWWIDFVSSPGVWLWGSCLAIALTLISSVVLCWGFSVGKMKSRPGFSLQGNQGSLALAMFPLLLLIWWALIVRVGPYIATRVAGATVERTEPMHAIFISSRRSCDYRLKGPILDRSFPNYLCISESVFTTLASTNAPVTLRGKETVLGFHIQESVASKVAK
jgi:hypothetical protein